MKLYIEDTITESGILNAILNHRFPIKLYKLRRLKILIVKFFRKYLTQKHWFHYFYHRVFGHRIIENTGYDWCEFCNYHQERFEEELYIATFFK